MKDTFEEIGKLIRKFLKEKGAGIIDVLFLMEIIYLIYMPGLIQKNLLLWNGINFGKAFYNIGRDFYFRYIGYELAICILILLILITIYYRKHNRRLHNYPDGFKRGHSAFVAIIRLLRLIWYFLHAGWTIFLLIAIFSGYENTLYPFFNNLYNPLNIAYLIFVIIKVLSFTKEKMIHYGDIFSQKELITNFYIIDEKSDYILVKNTFLEKPMFCLMLRLETETIQYEHLDYSESFSEMVVEFDRRANASNKCFDVEIPERERPVKSIHE